MQSGGCKRDTVPVAVGQWYNFYEFGYHLGNVGRLDGLISLWHPKQW